jgi:hypothetical protein
MPQKRHRLLIIRDLFFWIGVAFAVASLSVVAASNVAGMSHLDRQPVPLSWALAGVAIIALMVAEQCNSAAPTLSPNIGEPVKPAEPETRSRSVSPVESAATPEASPHAV